MELNIHSQIDLITNSSTEIFTTCTESSVRNLKEFIQIVLNEAKCEKTVDELFDIEYSENEDSDTLDFDNDVISLSIKPKSDTNKDITNLLESIFESKEFYC